MSIELEGRIDVRLLQRRGRVASVDIRSSRPQLAQRLMAGRSPAEAADLAGTLFSLCGQAQRAAAVAACAAARDRADTAEAGANGRPVLAELAREHAWRLLLDWPRERGEPPDMAGLLALRQATPEGLADNLDACLRGALLGESPSDWLARDAAGLEDWIARGASLPARLLASLDKGTDMGISHGVWLPHLAEISPEQAMALAWRALQTPAFCARPDWNGAPAETGALARCRDHPLLVAWLARRGRGMGARMLARLVELAELPRRLREEPAPAARAWSIGSDMDRVGIAGVETSRGLLFHVARLRDGKVADYRILAPTEWNFHPDGPLAQALGGLDAGDGLASRARLVAHSLDPCVAFGVELAEADGDA
ncbi:MAG: nickel-dependent hydrogenase large subunit [Pseudomonadota bacterium]